jgi:hypothetical protein
MWIGFSFSQDFLGGHFRKFKIFSAPAPEIVLRAGKLRLTLRKSAGRTDSSFGEPARAGTRHYNRKGQVRIPRSSASFRFDCRPRGVNSVK